MNAGRKLGFSRAEWRRLAGFCGVIASLDVPGRGVLLCYAPQAPALAGLGFAAYMLGLRHAFDADHVAAVDDPVRYGDSAASKPATARPRARPRLFARRSLGPLPQASSRAHRPSDRPWCAGRGADPQRLRVLRRYGYGHDSDGGLTLRP